MQLFLLFCRFTLFTYSFYLVYFIYQGLVFIFSLGRYDFNFNMYFKTSLDFFIVLCINSNILRSLDLDRFSVYNMAYISFLAMI